MNTHKSLINAIKLLGYSHEQARLCMGVTLRWLEACLLNEEKIFADRLKKIRLFGPKLRSLMDNIIGKKEEASSLTALEIWDIFAFLESVIIYQNSSRYTSLFAKGHSLSPYCFDAISEIASSDKIKAQGGLRIHDKNHTVMCDENELMAYLNDLMDVVEFSSSQAPIGIMIFGIKHTMGLSYHKDKGWRFMDINGYFYDENPEVVVSREQLMLYSSKSKETDQSYFGANIFVTSAKNGLSEAQSSVLSHNLEQLRMQHPLTRELVARETNDVSLACLAAHIGDSMLFSQLAAMGANINFVSDDGTTLAHTAAINGHVAVLFELVKHGIDFNKADNNGMSPACFAAAQGHVAILVELAKHGVDFNKADNKGMHPACFAAIKGHVAVLAELAKHGVDFNKGGNEDFTPACFAAIKGHVAVLAELAKHGVDFNKGGYEGATPACLAAVQDHVAVLVELAKHRVDFNKADNKGCTPVFAAAQMGHILVLAELAKHKVDFNKSFSDTPANLIEFAKEYSVDVQERMGLFIKEQGEEKTQISMKPRDIAYIMGHSEIVKFLDNQEVDAKKEAQKPTPSLVNSIRNIPNINQEKQSWISMKNLGYLIACVGIVAISIAFVVLAGVFTTITPGLIVTMGLFAIKASDSQHSTNEYTEQLAYS